LLAVEESTKEIVKKAAIAVGSLKETEFDVRFNPDVYSPGVQHVDPDHKQLEKQRQLVKDAAAFLLTVQIPAFVSILFTLHNVITMKFKHFFFPFFVVTV
jgi:protein TIF31